MLYDIFKSGKRGADKQKKSEPAPRVVVDTREKNSLVIAELCRLGAEIALEQLEIGDYLIAETIIERKTFQDFISSIFNKRLVEQLANMQKYESRILILEGKDFEELEDTKINPNAIRGMILSISLDFKTPIIFTQDAEDTARFLLVLAKRQLKGKTGFTLHSRKPASKKEQKQYIIESFPNIGPKNAKKLLKKFKTIKNIINAPEEELEREIGKSKAEEFKLIDEEY